MPALGLLAFVPLVLSLIFGGPGFARGSDAVRSTPDLVTEAEVSPEDAATDDTLAALSIEPIVLPPLPIAEAQPTDPREADAPSAAQPAPLAAFRTTAASQPVVSAPFTPILNLLKPARVVNRQGGPPAITAEQIVTTAESLLRVPYVWGGTTEAGLDCSAFVSRAWGIGRRTTESLPGVAFQIDKEELLPGDILNLTIEQDPRGYGHVRLFAGWANSQHSRMWVYEETPPRSVHRVIAYDPRYTPLRRINYSPGNLAASHLVNMLFGRPDQSLAAPDSVDDGSIAADDADGADDDSAAPTDEPLDTLPHGLVGNVVQGHAAPAIGFAPLALFSGAQAATDWDHELRVTTWPQRTRSAPVAASSSAGEPSVAVQPLWQPTQVSWEPVPSSTPSTPSQERRQRSTSTWVPSASQPTWEPESNRSTWQPTPAPTQPSQSQPASSRTPWVVSESRGVPETSATPRPILPVSTPEPERTRLVATPDPQPTAAPVRQSASATSREQSSSRTRSRVSQPEPSRGNHQRRG